MSITASLSRFYNYVKDGFEDVDSLKAEELERIIKHIERTLRFGSPVEVKIDDDRIVIKTPR